MNEKYNSILYKWSNCFASLWPMKYGKKGQVTYLPRLIQEETKFPRFVRACPATMSLIASLRLLPWEALNLAPSRNWFGQYPIPPATYIATYLVKLDQKLPSMGHLRQYLVHHPALIWALGFPLSGYAPGQAYGFDPEASLPTRRHFGRVLRQLDNQHLQCLLDAQVSHLQRLLPANFGQTVSLDTKHLVAWVKENNPKAYIKGKRFITTQQPKGDPDCKVGCKRRHNRVTPAKEGQPAEGLSVSVGEFYWGYASGVVVTKVPGWGEFVLAEMTQTFDKGDTTYFFPLMTQVERRLGFRPPYAALDAAFDAFYVYDFFHSPDHDGFAAVPFSGRGGNTLRCFDENGLPLCEAGLPMPVKFTFMDRTSNIIPHRRAHHVCPLLYPQANGQTCPIKHKKWPTGGCTTRLADSPGARLRHQLDRQADAYLSVFSQRTAAERIFSQALNLGIERPKLRNQQAIANQNTLIYLLINLRALERVLAKLQLAVNR